MRLGDYRMGKVWKPADIDTLRHWVTTIIDEASDELDDWENQFITDIQIRIANNWKLTETQEKKLEEIYANRTK